MEINFFTYCYTKKSLIVILKKITKETGLKFIISNLLDLVAGKARNIYF